MSDENTPDTEQEAPPTVSLDDVKSIVAKSVNAAITQRLSQYDQKLEDTLSSQLEQIMSKTQASASNDDTPAEDDAVQAMRARLKEMEALLAAEKQERDKERHLRSVNEERAALKDVLQAEGVPSDRLKAAVAVLYTEDQRIGRDDHGNIQFLTQEEGYVDRASLKEGVAKFLKTDEGKIYLPPRDVSGSGNKGGRAPAPKEGSSLAEDVRQFAEQLLGS